MQFTNPLAMTFAVVAQASVFPPRPVAHLPYLNGTLNNGTVKYLNSTFANSTVPYTNGINSTLLANSTANSTKLNHTFVRTGMANLQFASEMIDVSVVQDVTDMYGKRSESVQVCRVRKTGEIRDVRVAPAVVVAPALEKMVSPSSTVSKSSAVPTHTPSGRPYHGANSPSNFSTSVAPKASSSLAVSKVVPSTHAVPSRFSTYTTDSSGQVDSVCIQMTFENPNYYFNQDGWKTHPEGTFGSLLDGKMCVETGFGGAAFIMKPDQITNAPQHHTKLECTFQKNGKSWCNVSAVDGFSVPMQCYANGQMIGGGDLFKGHKCRVQDSQGNCINTEGPSGTTDSLDKFFGDAENKDNKYWNVWQPKSASHTQILAFNIQDTRDFYCHIG